MSRPVTPYRVLETTTSLGTGNITLAGAVVGYRLFSDAMDVGETCCYNIEAVNDDGVLTGAWEIGVGTLLTSQILSRDTVYTSSNSNNPVSFSAGRKRVFITVEENRLDVAYTHDQAVADTTWTITHNLNKYPSVTLVDSSGRQVFGGIVYLTSNSVEVTFSAAFGGKAYLN